MTETHWLSFGIALRASNPGSIAHYRYQQWMTDVKAVGMVLMTHSTGFDYPVWLQFVLGNRGEL